MSLQLECSDDEPQRGVSTDDSLYRDEVPTMATSENRVRRGARRIVVACCITLLCHGRDIVSTHLQFRHGESTVQIYFPQVCCAIYEALKHQYMKVCTLQRWVESGSRFVGYLLCYARSGAMAVEACERKLMHLLLSCRTAQKWKECFKSNAAVPF